MKLAFIHHSLPGQFKHLAEWFGRQPNCQTVFITRRKDRQVPGVRSVPYDLHREANPLIHHYLSRTEEAVLHGQAVVRALADLRKEGFVPDIVVGHTGWGETMFIKEMMPDTALLAYSEFYYRGRGADTGFDPMVPVLPNDLFCLHVRNSQLLLSLVACDRAFTATEWQRRVHPPEFHGKIEVVHEGIDTAFMCPDSHARFRLPNGRELTPADEVVTYVARSLEPHRGFPTFIRSLPRILAERPNSTVVVAGDDGVSYSVALEGGTWLEKMLAEVDFDRSRVHFLGHVPYLDFRRILQISSVHVYLSYPFVLSWSMLEAMSVGCLIVGSRTAPVLEVLEDGKNGILVDFFSHDEVADAVVTALEDRGGVAHLRRAARETVLRRFELRACLNKQVDLIRSVAR